MGATARGAQPQARLVASGVRYLILLLARASPFRPARRRRRAAGALPLALGSASLPRSLDRFLLCPALFLRRFLSVLFFFFRLECSASGFC